MTIKEAVKLLEGLDMDTSVSLEITVTVTRCENISVANQVNIEELNLNNRAFRRLKEAGLNTVEDILNAEKEIIESIPSFGKDSLARYSALEAICQYGEAKWLTRADRETMRRIKSSPWRTTAKTTAQDIFDKPKSA